MDQHLAVRFGDKGVSRLQQLPAKGRIIVDFPVEHQHQGLVLVIKRLLTGFQINDAQPAEAHGDAVV